MPNRPVTITRQRAAGFVLILTLFYVAQGAAFGWLLDRQNHDRLASCRNNYEGVRTLFKPQLDARPDAPDVTDFNARVDALKAGCKIQTKGRPNPALTSTEPR